MSNVSYRVILVRPPEEGRGAIVTVLFVGLLLLAGIGAAFDLQRKRKKLQEVPLVNGETFKRTCRKLAENYRSFWRTHRPAEADVLWCDRDRLEKIIADLKASGSNPDFDVVRSRTRSLAILANVPLLNRFLNLSAGSAVNEILTMDPSKVSDTRRLGDTIKFLIDKQALSPFVGEKLEWRRSNLAPTSNVAVTGRQALYCCHRRKQTKRLFLLQEVARKRKPDRNHASLHFTTCQSRSIQRKKIYGTESNLARSGSI